MTDEPRQGRVIRASLHGENGNVGDAIREILGIRSRIATPARTAMATTLRHAGTAGPMSWPTGPSGGWRKSSRYLRGLLSRLRGKAWCFFTSKDYLTRAQDHSPLPSNMHGRRSGPAHNGEDHTSSPASNRVCRYGGRSILTSMGTSTSRKPTKRPLSRGSTSWPVWAFIPYSTDSNGKGGFHLRVPFEEPTITAHVQLIRWLTRGLGKAGTRGKRPRCFRSNTRSLSRGLGRAATGSDCRVDITSEITGRGCGTAMNGCKAMMRSTSCWT